MKVSSKKQKGKRLEEWVVNLIKNYNLDKYAYRRADSGSGSKKEDVTTTVLPVFIECKNHEKWNYKEWYKDADSKNKGQGVPTLLFLGHNNIEEPLVYLSFGDFLVIQDFNIETPVEYVNIKLRKNFNLEKLEDIYSFRDKPRVYCLGTDYVLMTANDLAGYMYNAMINGWFKSNCSNTNLPSYFRYKEKSKLLGQNTWANNNRVRYEHVKQAKQEEIDPYQQEVFNLMGVKR